MGKMRRSTAFLSALLLLPIALTPAWGAAKPTKATTKVATTPPTPVRSLMAVDTRPDRITLGWQAPTKGLPIDSYLVMWSLDGGITWVGNQGVGKTSFSMTNVETNTVYTFAISALNVKGISSVSMISATANYPTPLLLNDVALAPYQGLGFWIDMFSWRKVNVKSKKFTATYQPFTCESIDEAASYGARTLFIQTAMPVEDPTILDPADLTQLIACAKKDNLYVVAWYYPQLLDVNLDFTRALASATLPGVDAFALDIESRKVGDVFDRNKRLVDLSDRLHAALPTMALAAVTYTPYNLDDVQPNTWPYFPWAALAKDFAVWQPMTYWNVRKGELARGAAYTTHTINGLRTHLGPEARLNIVGGLSNNGKEIAGMVDSMQLAGAGVIGGGLYQWSQMTCAAKDAQLRINSFDGSGTLRNLPVITPKYTKFCVPKPIPPVTPLPTTTPLPAGDTTTVTP
ncbi:MAG: fibronectin type III domain-containing protein [Actinobacteria bacterium]|nr:MAG: fibronectin type III domain-containing protein [Actinomycetota bacterium]